MTRISVKPFEPARFGERTVPKRLFKYRSISALAREFTRQIIAECTACFASRSDFNDPFDCKFKLNMDGSEEEKLRLCVQVCRNLNPRLSDGGLRNLAEKLLPSYAMHANGRTIVDRALQNIGIFCLSEQNDDILMWSHYADCHRGICLEFSNIPDGHLHPVEYRKDYPSFNFFELMRDNELLKKVLLIKSEH
jgi:hypothetical protein